MASCQPVQVTCKAEVFKTKVYGKRQVGKGAHSIYSGSSCSRRVILRKHYLLSYGYG